MTSERAVEQGRPREFPPQHQQRHPGLEHEMDPQPQETAPWYRGSSKLEGKVALVTGGDSGIGRSVAILFAREGANVCIVYLDEHEDAEATRRLVKAEGRECLTISGDVGRKDDCLRAVQETVDTFGRLDVLVNNAAVQFTTNGIEDVSEEQLERTFRTNIFSMFFMTQAAAQHLQPGSSIINTTSITAFRGSGDLLDYSSTKGAILGFTRSLAQSLAPRQIRVNAVAPGPIWTPLIPSSFPEEKVQVFGKNTLLGRAGQPEEVAPSYVFLASQDSSYVTGQTIHPNGGQIVGA